MSGNSDPGRERWERIAQVAARQHGNVTRRQLVVLGATDNAIAHQVATGHLFRVHRGVYAVGRRPVVVLERAAAAVLACGPGAALSHGSALALWGLDAVDCTPRLSDDDLTRAVNDARHKRLSSPTALADLLARYPNHPGAARLRPFAQSTSRLTLSKMEDRFAKLCACYGLPTPQFNVEVCGYTVDALFAPQRLIVELDSWEFHQDRSAFETDRLRDADTLAAGYATLRITWERRDDVEAARLREILRQRA